MLQRGIFLMIKRTPALLSYNTGITCNNGRHLALPMATTHIAARATYSTSNSHTLLAEKKTEGDNVKKNLGFFAKFFKIFNFIDKKKYRSMNLGVTLYENTVDNLNYMQFFKGFNMEDTMFSWYLITELHVWMLSTRFMVDQKYGLHVRNCLIEAMWNDMTIRMEKLGGSKSSVRKKQLKLCSLQLQAIMLCYDEGLLSDDITLANALWEIFFCGNCNNPLHLEQLLIYVRKTMHMLDKIPTDKLWASSTIPWLDIQSCR